MEVGGGGGGGGGGRFGGGGGKLAKAFLDLGFNKTLLINTTAKDQPEGIDPKHLVLIPDADGVAKNISYGKSVFQSNSAVVEDALRTRLGKVDWIFVLAGGGGGTGYSQNNARGGGGGGGGNIATVSGLSAANGNGGDYNNAGNGGRWGGGGGACSSFPSRNPGYGGKGAVRIVWPGDTKSFPATDGGDD